ncbi:SNF2 family DNA or RNA helicase [Bradyrhizobium ottawaense]|uniref:DEAD/DEAH box helicase n=1 Tax=Bradyrhizobium ottawaense TaxID=931866 RepID=UPI003515FFE0
MANELVVLYERDSRLATLEYRGDASVWPRIRRVCQDKSDQCELIGSSGLRLPWWTFLAARPDLDFLAERYGFVISPGTGAQEKLREAEDVTRQYHHAIDAPPTGEEQLISKLKENKFGRPLTAEQLRNVRKLTSWASGATFSVPGAGKTTEALALFAFRRAEGSRLLVVCPKNAFAAWEEQLQECLPSDAPFVRLRGGKASIQKALSQNPDKALLSYHQLPNVVDLVADYIDTPNSFLFLDESHKIKRGFTGVIGNNLLSTSELPRTKLIMSGTPMPNDISDLVPQFRFLFPEIPADEDDVEQFIKPVYVRTTKDELGLPPVRHTIKRIALRPAQFSLYELLRSEAARQARTISHRDRALLRRAGQSALRLMQLVTNPALLSRMQFEHGELLAEVLAEGDSPKLEYACYRARELAFEGKKSIIWSSFVNNVELVARRLIDLGAEYIHGGVDAGDEDEEGTREQKIARFHEDDNCFVLVANPAACGEGISLHTVCHDAIYLDRNYNAAQFLQSQDRIHRLGLPPDVITNVEILVAPDTIDESVNRRLSVKIGNMARVLDDRSLQVEPEVVDLDSNGFSKEDFDDFLKHVSETAETP